MKRNDILRIKEEEGLKQEDVIALAPGNDPFLCGAPAQERDAKWFADLWKTHFKGQKIHIRMMHYVTMTAIQPTYQILKKNPQTNKLELVTRKYEGSKKDWNYMLNASKSARYMELVPYNAIIDNKNVSKNYFTTWKQEDVAGNLDDIDSDNFKKVVTDGLGNMFNPHLQMGVVMEIWIEKSSQDFIITPLAKEFGLNTVTCEGETSITMADLFIRRIAWYYMRRRIKKFVVFYISDFDPAGRSMPKAFARKVEYMVYNNLKRDYAITDAEIKIDLVALTGNQVKQYNLPTAPIDEEKLKNKSYLKRTQKFYNLYGVRGIVELEALEALHPNSLKSMLSKRINIFYDKDVTKQLGEWQEKIDELVEEAIKDVDFESIKKEAIDKPDWSEVKEYYDDNIDDQIPEAEHDTEKEEKIFWLYDSRRDYMEQLKAYREYDAGKETNDEDLE
jgi:hypothetical protein